MIIRGYLTLTPPSRRFGRGPVYGRYGSSSYYPTLGKSISPRDTKYTQEDAMRPHDHEKDCHVPSESGVMISVNWSNAGRVCAYGAHLLYDQLTMKVV